MLRSLPFAVLSILPGLAAQHSPPRVSLPEGWLHVEAVDPRGRRPFLPDTVYARRLLEKDAPFPKPGDEERGASGKRASWRKVPSDAKGNVRCGRGGFAAAIVRAKPGVYLCALRGASVLFVDGTPFPGDVYGNGDWKVPVELKETSRVFVTGIRGGFRLRFEAAAQRERVRIAAFDRLLPDVVRGEPFEEWAGLLLVNTTLKASGPLRLVVEGPGIERAETSIPEGLPPLGMQKAPVRLRGAPLDQEFPSAEGGVEIRLRLLDAKGAVLAEDRAKLRILEPSAPHRHTFLSQIDASAQEYAVLRPAPAAAGAASRPASSKTGLVLSLHGAGVPCLNQARAYSPKADFWIVAPTNRRRFGFDWQDWGRRDAYEVLDEALRRSGVSRRRVYLTGHSMGGHGTWHLAANDPDGFAAAAPSAGWADFDSYTGRPGTPLADLWDRADLASLTRRLLPNLLRIPLFVLHGTKDQSVPLREAEGMLKALAEAGRSEVPHHFEKGAGHWWDGKKAEGADCVDWPGIFDLFRASEIGDEPDEISFLTVSPDIDRDHHWISVFQPLEYGRPISVKARRDRKKRRVVIETRNLRAFAIRMPPEAAALEPRAPFDPATAWRLVIDGVECVLAPQALAGKRPVLHLRREEGKETPAGEAPFLLTGGPPPPSEKGPGHEGPIKRAFDHDFVLVYGTAGNEEERALLLARARYDAGVFWYRGNGRARVLSDRFYLAHAREPWLRDANLVLYGNADSNAAWKPLVPGETPLLARRGRLVWNLKGRRTSFDGPDLAAFVLRPRPDRDGRLLLLCADTGPRGARAAFRHLFFVSGVGYPDYVLFGSDVLLRGDPAVRFAGFFDHRWR